MVNAMSHFLTLPNLFVLGIANLFVNLRSLMSQGQSILWRHAPGHLFRMCTLVAPMARIAIILGYPQPDQAASHTAEVNQSSSFIQRNILLVEFARRKAPAIILSFKVRLWLCLANYTSFLPDARVSEPFFLLPREPVF
jgi:hypothetical protein